MNTDSLLKRSLESFVDSMSGVAISDCTAAKSLAQAEEVLQYLKMSERERRAYERHLDSVNYENDALDTARKEGIEEGRKEGIEEGRKEGIEAGREEGRKEATLQVAKNMLQQGLDISIIAAATGLPEDEIRSL